MERRGEWLQLRITTEIQDEFKAAGPIAGLCRLLRIPQTYAAKLVRNEHFQIVSSQIRLKLFVAQTDDYIPEWMDLDVLYEDDHCLVINKPAGLLVHPTMPGQTGTLGNGVASYYECSGQAVAVRHIHRLDEWTSGPVLYAKHELAQLKLDEAMRAKIIDRIYVTLAEGTFKVNRGTLDYPIGRDRHHKQRRRVSPTGDTAVTHFEVVEQYDTMALVRLKLDTGRTHQIRVHLSHIGHPIVGDTLYGGSTSTMHRQALHGESLSFSHPITNERITVHCPWPQDITETLAHLTNHSSF